MMHWSYHAEFGPREMMETVYAPNAVTDIISGKAVPMVIRAHELIDVALD